MSFRGGRGGRGGGRSFGGRGGRGGGRGRGTVWCIFFLFHVISIEKLTIHQYLYYKLLMIRNAR